MRSAVKRLAPGSQNGLRPQRSDHPDRISNGRHRYEIGAEIGRGGFAVVFQAFNVETGYFVAVKRFPLHAIDDESLGSIESEIELMKKLNHPNIVKYIDTIRTDAFLFIVLEYMENGSLANVIKKFGAFSESLTAIYTTQVLRGLKYLHEQGVLHRDIKGANILTTKDGHVKLADFGVAVKDTDVHCSDCDVVGTPYWMAPEIIAMSTPTVACDIWSVGCTVIELLTGKPPYFDCAPMAAMFRIVQDDYPPLPEDISQSLRDFLLECFQKEPTLRANASKALAHPWLQTSTNGLCLPTEVKDSLTSSSSILEDSHTIDNIIVNTIRTFRQEEAKSSLKIHQEGERYKDTTSTPKALPSAPLPLVNASSESKTITANDNTTPSTESTVAAGEKEMEDEWDEDIECFDTIKSKNPLPVNTSDNPLGREDPDFTQSAEKDDDDWPSSSRDVTIKKKVVVSLDTMADISDFLGSQDVGQPQAKFSGLIQQRKNITSYSNTPSLHNISINRWTNENQFTSQIPHVNTNSNLLRFQEVDDMDMDLSAAFSEMEDNEGLASVSASPYSSTASQCSHMKRMMSSKLKSRMLTSRVNRGLEEENFDDFITYQFAETLAGTRENKDMHSSRAQRILSYMERIRPETEDGEVIDICERILDIFTKNPEQKEHFVTLYGVLPILEMLDSRHMSLCSRSTLETVQDDSHRSPLIQAYVLRVINKLVEDNVRAQEQLSLLGLIPVIIRILGRIVVGNSVNSMENSFSQTSNPIDPVVLEAAKFVHQISSSANFTLLQLLIGAGGLPALVHMISFSSQISHLTNDIDGSNNQNNVTVALSSPEGDGDISRCPTLESGDLLSVSDPSSALVTSSVRALNSATEVVYMGIDCVLHVFSVQSSRTRDFCRLFMKFGLLSHLSVAFAHIFKKQKEQINSDKSSTSDKMASQEVLVYNQLGSAADMDMDSADMLEYLEKCSEIEESVENRYLHSIATIFLHFSRSDAVVADNMAQSGVLEVLNDALQAVLTMRLVPIRVIDLLLKCIKNLSMEPSTLEALEDAGTIPTLINLLDSPLSRKSENHVLPTMFNLCRVSRRREEQAAVSGFIPHLQRLILENSHLKQFALRIICDFAQHNSAVCRAELWKYDGVVFYINLLHEKYWQTFALNALATWLANDCDRVEGVLCVPENLCTLVAFFRSVSIQEISTLHKPLLDLMSKSQQLCRALSCSGLFVSSLVQKLHDADPIVLRSLLKIIQLLHQHHPCPRELVLGYGLYDIVDMFCLAEKQVLVYQIATRLLKDFHTSTMT